MNASVVFMAAEDVSWFLVLCLVKPDKAQLAWTLPQQIIMRHSPRLQWVNAAIKFSPLPFIHTAMALPSTSYSRTHWVNTQRHNVFPLNENHAQALMKRMKNID